MTDSTLRTAIARAIHDGPNAQAQYRAAGIEPHPFGECAYTDQYLADADAVLAVLADLLESVIERAAEGLHDAAFGQELPEAPIDLARAALRAAFGGERDDV
ncbi:hypothetical protein [Gulosibacter molinativorax]|uniref:Uncharacterized protein n=1 Tax=Gulosibacter molinativorax TaxID=256821 RepID=A0ABT7C781_9MICO|nr:hypothetical protein [Gulosibacter molinativorax]MDJ1370647.1 hypothetical protein [Gulosibacter molinativorax]